MGVTTLQPCAPSALSSFSCSLVKAAPLEGTKNRYSTWSASAAGGVPVLRALDRKSTRLNSSHANISYAVFCLKKKNNDNQDNWKQQPFLETEFFRCVAVGGQQSQGIAAPFCEFHTHRCVQKPAIGAASSLLGC